MSQVKILYSEKFGFQSGHSTEHAVLQLAKQIYELCEDNLYTLGVFIDSSKSFDSDKHSIIFKKMMKMWHTWKKP